MLSRVRTVFVLALLVALTACSSSGPPRDIQAQALVDQSRVTLELFKTRQRGNTPLFNAGLREARGIMIFPEIFEAAVGVGGQGGSGVMVTRDAAGTWGFPAFYRLSGATLGIQLGAQSTEVIFLLMTDEAVNKVISSPSQFGIGAQATLGEISGSGSSATTLRGASVIAFTKGTGVFLGGALSGAYVSSQNRLNQVYYKDDSVTPTTILIDHAVSNPAADGLRRSLTMP